MKKYKRVICIPDVHVPLQDNSAVNCVLKAIELVKPTIAVFLGDFGEWWSVSPYKYKRRKRPPLEYTIPEVEKDGKAVNRVLDQFDDAFKGVGLKEKYFLEGNHCKWLDEFVSEFPYIDEFLPENIMRLKQRKYNYHEYGEYLKIGNLYYYHGHHHRTINHARQHVLTLGANIMYAHGHDVSRASVPSMTGVHAAWAIGCLKKMDAKHNKWLGGKRVNWGNSFAIVDYFNKDSFVVNVVDITGGKTFLWGQEINGNK